MERRALSYTDDTSDKFWRISLEGAEHTVCYGRVGQKGKAQVKAFESAAAAKKSFEKLVKAKLKKGYTDIEFPKSVVDAVAQETKTGKGETVASKQKKKAKVTDKVSAQVKPSLKEAFEIKRQLNLSEKDWARATWRLQSRSAQDYEKTQQQVDTWQASSPHHVQAPHRKYLSAEHALPIIFQLGSAAQVKDSVQRLDLNITQPEDIRAWLAHTEYGGFQRLCHSLIQCSSYRWKDAMLKAFLGSVQAPEAAPYALELWLSLKKSKPAREWLLEENLTEAVVGLIPVAVGKGHTPLTVKPKAMSEAAIDFLRSVKRKGHDALLKFAIAREDEETAEKIRSLVIDVEDMPCLDEQSTPSWLTEGLATLPPLKKKIDWVMPTALPDIVVGEACLTVEQTQGVLNALKLSTFESVMPLLRDLKQQATTQSVDEFVWRLFERWLREGGNSKEKWAMHALGLLGSDAVALKLTPLIRKWPGESQHGKAKEGLNCLRAMGTDTALMQINGVAQKIKYKALKARAQACMAEIAADLKLTAAQLEDRIIPDCDLDSRGHRVFDFGPRQFQFALGGDLKPFVRDEKGKLRASLPKPNQKDDAELAGDAIAAWKLMKKQIGSVVKLQAERLEAAMVLERRWPLSDFQTLLVAHPLMIHLVQRVVWGGYDKKGQLVQTFRVAEDRSFADELDETVELKGVVAIGIVHPLLLSEESRGSWGESLSDYEIIPPFPQLNRETYSLTADEENAEELERFVSVVVPASALGRLMQKQGWLKGALHDHGDYHVHYKYFEAADLTAVVGDYEHQFVQYMDGMGDDAINACLFLVGHHPEPYEYPKKGSWYSKKLAATCQKLGEVPPLVMSEVMRDLSIVAAAGVDV